jgi:hypothetical protein
MEGGVCTGERDSIVSMEGMSMGSVRDVKVEDWLGRIEERMRRVGREAAAASYAYLHVSPECGTPRQRVGGES